MWLHFSTIKWHFEFSHCCVELKFENIVLSVNACLCDFSPLVKFVCLIDVNSTTGYS